MGVSLPGPDHLISDAIDGINRVGHQLVSEERYEAAIHAIDDISDNPLIRKVKQMLVKINDLCNSYRIFNITIINYGIMSMFGYLLVKLTFRYHKLYTKSSILATIATNVVLYGISDTLAQSITQFLEKVPTSTTSHNHGMASPRWSRSSDAVRITLNDNENSATNLFVDYGDDPESDVDSGNTIGAQAYTVDIENNGNDDYSPVRFQPIDSSSLSRFDFRRFFGFISWGFIMAFIQVAWYLFLNAMFTDMPTIVSVLERDLTDQLIFSPISMASFFAFTTIIIEKGDAEAYKEKMYKLYITTLAVSFCVWFPVQFINFAVMPKKFQVPFSSSVGVIWNCFLSYRNAAVSS